MHKATIILKGIADVIRLSAPSGSPAHQLATNIKMGIIASDIATSQNFGEIFHSATSLGSEILYAHSTSEEMRSALSLFNLSQSCSEWGLHQSTNSHFRKHF